jgi:hypothetical protein
MASLTYDGCLYVSLAVTCGVAAFVLHVFVVSAVP